MQNRALNKGEGNPNILSLPRFSLIKKNSRYGKYKTIEMHFCLSVSRV